MSLDGESYVFDLCLAVISLGHMYRLMVHTTSGLPMDVGRRQVQDERASATQLLSRHRTTERAEYQARDRRS
jgi:hypothetical protein